jgi:hypothetical protein
MGLNRGRLFVVLVALWWTFPVALVTWMLWPGRGVSKAEVYERLSSQSARVIADYNFVTGRLPPDGPAEDVLTEATTGLPITVVAVEGDSLVFMADTPQDQMEKVRREYAARQAELVGTRKLHLLIGATAWWVFPLLGIYLLGMAFAWIRRGFHAVT